MTGQLLIQLTIWLALAAWAGTCFLLLLGGLRNPARLLWSAGAGLFLLHALSAYHYAYGWDHELALVETARQARDVTGVAASWGLYLNFALGLAWIADAGWWWKAGLSAYAARSNWISRALHGFFLFMIINGAIVFVQGPVRWISACVLMLLAVTWFVQRSRAT